MSVIRECTIKRTTITHSSGLKIWICDQWYEYLTLKEAALSWIRKDFHPVSNPIMIIFGVAELWKEASNYPTRQVIFMLAKDGSVVAYDRGVMFYMCPTFQDFWTADIVFEFYNAIFPAPVRKYVRQMYISIDGYVNFYNRLRMSRVVLDAAENGKPITRPFSFRGNRFMKMLVTSDIAISHGGIPPLFSDRVALHCNVDNRFFDMYWKAKCGTGAKPFICNATSFSAPVPKDGVNTHVKMVASSENTDDDTNDVIDLSKTSIGLSPLSRPFYSISGKDTSSVIFVPYTTDGGCQVDIDGMVRKRTTERDEELNEKMMKLSSSDSRLLLDVTDVNLSQYNKEESAKDFSFVIRNDQGSC